MSRLLRHCVIVLVTLGAIAISTRLVVDRWTLGFQGVPALGREDPRRDHWLYRELHALAGPGDTLGIWGWAAHHWVYSTLTPATRESSTEFAMLDLGGGYYRRRYLAALADRPPAFFVEAVGARQFLFKDRAEMGTAMLPELDAMLRRDYLELYDDTDDRLLVRKDAFAACCGFAEDWRRVDGTLHRSRSPRPGMAAMAFAGPDGHALRAPLPAGTIRVVIPFVRLHPTEPGRIDALAGAGGARAAQCAERLAVTAVGRPDLCVLKLDAASHHVLIGTGAVAMGQPIVVRARRAEPAP